MLLLCTRCCRLAHSGLELAHSEEDVVSVGDQLLLPTETMLEHGEGRCQHLLRVARCELGAFRPIELQL